ncbi:uncharacterized protein DUF1565 [Prosthecobacter fusiformis]|uniref:Uncharacterized protein DUF1565 n=1 Tax=Prosthecobacter fusiformis TaxID=48464 RepID=A0A4R7RJL9_9BACT|nr:right-handed parallel beta-helix repeat-containing protein [Prosthecobacter fusiformis]TDU64318.1 uncharacterized protein DUF1565 [Prosthecobacter fusiformis]
MKFLACLFIVSLACTASAQRALHVDPANGNDINDAISAPVKTIARGILLAEPGDTVHLATGTYFESVNLAGKKGLPGQPITLDGHGAIIDGSEPVNATEWESLGQGLYRKTDLLPGLTPAALRRWYFLWDGRMDTMGRTAKGPSAALKKVAELKPGEWTYEEAEKAFYIKLTDGQSLDVARLRYPARSNGVSLSGQGRHLTVRNLTCTHVWNDGFNIHGDQLDTVFENITAIECGDDGFSAHETAECRINGFTSLRNSTGLCDIGSSVTHFKNIFISGCYGHDVFFHGNTAHSLENALIESRAAHVITVTHRGSETSQAPCRATFKNVLLRRFESQAGEVRITGPCQIEMHGCTLFDLSSQVSAEATLSMTNTQLGPPASASTWGADAAALEALRRE